jgi:ABC-type Na+ efflux pump permease subunit
MNKFWAIVKKDFRESFRNRSTYLYIVVLLVFSFTYYSTYGSRIDALTESGASPDVMLQAAQALMNSFAATLPLIFSIWICTIFATYSVVTEKLRHNLESLMVTPISLNQIWMGKSLAVALPSFGLGLVVSIVVYVVLGYTKVVPQFGFFIFPDWLSIVSSVIMVPILVFIVVLLVIYLQMTISNPRMGNFAFIIIFFALFFSMNALTSSGLQPNYGLFYLIAIVVCGVAAFLVSRSFTKEKVLLSSKEH